MTERERALLQGKKINPLTANESALAYAVAHGTPEPTYETVFEAALGDGSGGPEGLAKAYDTGKFFDVVGASGEYFINSEDCPLVKSEDNMMGYNRGDDGFDPADPSKPVYVVYQPDEGNCQIAASDDSLSNTTVRILKKVEQGGGAGKLVVHLTEKDVEGEKAYSADKSVAEIIAADAAGQVVECEYEDRRYGLFSVVKEEDGTACHFVFTIPSEAQSISASVIAGESVDGVDTWELLEYDYFTLPAYDTTDDLGKVLTVTANGLAWVTPT